jgi:outer membrane protein insertion porin family
MKFFRFLLIFLFTVSCAHVWAAGPERIVKIEVTGNERIEKGYILNATKTKEGDLYDVDKLRDDIKNIYKTGFFSDVQIDVKESDSGKAVTFIVMERPPVKAIYISGNKKIKTNDIRDKLKIKMGTVLNTDKIKESVDEIKKLYAGKGYYAARINYGIDYGDGADASVTFSIEEPAVAYVRNITFTGNKAFKASKLRGFMRVREKGILSWITGSGILDEENLEDDRKNIEAFYHDNGYVKAQVGIPDIKISQDGRAINISLPVEEGSIYKVGTVDFKGDVIFTKDELFKGLKVKTGNTFRSSLFQEDVLNLTDMYQDKGYAFCDIAPLTNIDDEGLKVNITFEVTKGQEIFFNRINILGNIRTRDKVVRRELRFAEGDRFSSSALKKSKRFLRNTMFFKDVDMKIVKTDEPDKVNLDLSVEERPTGSLSLGVGYSSTDRVIVTGVVSQENFLGTGRKMFLEAGLGAFTQQFRFSYLEPYIFDKNLSAGFQAFNFKRIMDYYDYDRTGGSVSLGRPLTEYTRGGLRYRWETVEVTNIDAGASTFIKAQEGKGTTSSITANVGQNTIDDLMNPTRGVNTDVSFELAGGPFGGTNDFYRAMAIYGRYVPVKFLDSSFFLRGTAGTIRAYGGKDIPIYEKFYVGGLHTVRGFRYGEAGPKDETDQVIGAKNQLYFNLEWIVPIYKPAGIKGVVFYDIGAGFDDNKGFLFQGLRSAAGFGIRWFSPLGPIRLELGFNLSPRTGEKNNVFDFAIGTQY